MSESQNAPQNTENTGDAGKQATPETLDHEHNPKSETDNAADSQNDAENQISIKLRQGLKGYRCYNFRRTIERWKTPLGLLIPSIFSFLLLIVVGVQAVIYYLQLDVQRTAEQAWVSVKGLSLKSAPKAGEFAIVDIVFTNTGKSPANNTETQAWIGVYAENTPFDKLIYKPIEGPTSKGLVPPQIDFSQEAKTPAKLDDDTVQELTSIPPTHRIYIYGFIKYDDIFGRHWKNTFCQEQRPEFGLLFSPCPEGNRTFRNTNWPF